MAIEQRIINGSLTELYINGGGDFMTQAYPTNFHTFCTRRFLVEGESADDWKLVTVAEKAALEKADAEWVRPSQELIDRWEAACNRVGSANKGYSGKYGCYNQRTGYFELNGILDIGNLEAEQILEFGTFGERYSICRGDSSSRHAMPQIRTTIPSAGFFGTNVEYPSLKWMTWTMEVIKWGTFAIEEGELPLANQRFDAPYNLQILSSSLKHIYDIIRPMTSSVFNLCYNEKSAGYVIPLETVYLWSINCDIVAYNLPKLSLKSLRYWVEHAANTRVITIQVHEDVFAKLTDQAGHPDWYQLNQDAAAKQITFATA